jgi:predicted methyltransferase
MHVRARSCYRARMKHIAFALLFFAVGCATPAPAPAPTTPAGPTSQPVAQPISVVDAPDRDAADKALDEGRNPKALLEFIGVKPGMKVAELMAGGGYTAELLARAVAPDGVVYAQNNKFILDRFAEKPWAARLAKPVMANVKRLDTELEAPFPADVNGTLDVVTMVLFYHDTVWLKTDRAKMNKAIFDALKPGGTYIVIDHSAKEGRGVEDAQTLHRIEESVVKSEVTAAGFELAGEGGFLRNAADARDWNASPSSAAEKRGTSDRFVLEFKKRAP